MTCISYLVRLISTLQLCAAKLFSLSSFTTDSSNDQSIPPFRPSHLHSDSFQLLHLSSFTKAFEWELSKTLSSWRVPPAPFTTHSHPPLPIINPSLPWVRMRNAWVHSRLNEVNIAGMRPYVIAEPTPQKQKGACSSGEPQRTTEAFQCIGAKKKNRNKRGKKVLKC